MYGEKNVTNLTQIHVISEKASFAATVIRLIRRSKRTDTRTFTRHVHDDDGTHNMSAISVRISDALTERSPSFILVGPHDVYATSQRPTFPKFKRNR